MSDNERPRDRYRERGSYREPREGRERGGTPSDRRNRSRSPRRERGGRRDRRNRSRSLGRREENERDDAREVKGGSKGDRDYDRDHDRDDRRRRDPPRGPRGGTSAPTGPRRPDLQPRGGSTKPPSGPRASKDIVPKEDTPDVEMTEVMQKPEDMDDETWEMKKTMGFMGFKSTKDTKVPGNDKNYGVRKDKQMEARQYMNRQGGFNRPLSPSRG